MPESHRHVSKVVEECNWLQALEGGIDTSHAPILHRNISTTATRPRIPFSGPLSRVGHRRWKLIPRLWVPLCWGSTAADGQTYVRTYHFIMPFTQIRPQQFRLQGERVRPRARALLGAYG